MDQKTANPLLAHFRQPAIYYQLPSQGQFWTSGLDLPESGEIPVYPMTARDEIALRTPDALLNGQGVIDVVHSCCPNIKDAWRMPSVDVDATLIAIRIASYGNNMSFDTKCPHCAEENSFDVNLEKYLSGITMPDYSKKVEYNGMLIKLKPQAYFDVNQANQIAYEEQRILNALNDDSIDDDTRLTEYKKHMDRLIDLNIRNLATSTEYIEITSTGTVVTEFDHIYEFYCNSEAGINKAIKARLDEMNKEGSIPDLEAECQSCATKFGVPLVFDYSNFFVLGS